MMVCNVLTGLFGLVVSSQHSRVTAKLKYFFLELCFSTDNGFRNGNNLL